MPESHVVAWDWGAVLTGAPPCLDGHVSVWLFRLDSALGRMARETLSVSEQARAERFVRPSDRQHWVCSRVQLRRILGWVTGQPPGAVLIDRDARGKPHLHAGSSTRRIEFSISHSGPFGMVAVGGTHAVGVDIEAVQTRWSVLEDLLDSTLAPSERNWVDGSTEPAIAFARLWTRKEAVVKATGTGLLTDMRDVVVVGASGHSADAGIRVPMEGLLVIDVVSPSGYCAAMAVSDSTRRITVFVEMLVETA